MSHGICDPGDRRNGSERRATIQSTPWSTFLKDIKCKLPGCKSHFEYCHFNSQSIPHHIYKSSPSIQDCRQVTLGSRRGAGIIPQEWRGVGGAGVPAPAVHTVLPQDMRLSAAKHHRLSEVNSPRKLFRVSAAALAFSQNSAPAGHVMLTRPLRDPRASADVGDAEESSSSRSPTTLRPWVVLTSGWVSI